MDHSQSVKKTSQESDQKLRRSPKPVEGTKSSVDSSVLGFDSGTDMGYRSGDIDSGKISSKTEHKPISEKHGTLKKQHSMRFDSGLGSDVFSPLPSESDIHVDKEDDLKTRKSVSSEVQRSESILLWQDIYKQDKDGDTILHLAVVEARSDVIFPLIRHAPHPDFLDICNDLCQTPLHLSTLMGKSNIVRRLVAAGATLDIQDHHGNTALHIASRNGDLDCVRAILEPLTAEEIRECNCLYDLYVEDNDLTHLINLKNYNGQTSIHLAAMGGFKKVLECLYDHGADVNDKEGKSGKTALHFAVENMNFELVKILVSTCQAKVNVSSYAGQTPIHTAWTLYNRNRHRAQLNIFEYLKKNSTEKWETPSDSEVSSDDSESSEELSSPANRSTNISSCK